MSHQMMTSVIGMESVSMTIPLPSSNFGTELLQTPKSKPSLKSGRMCCDQNAHCPSRMNTTHCSGLSTQLSLRSSEVSNMLTGGSYEEQYERRDH